MRSKIAKETEKEAEVERCAQVKPQKVQRNVRYVALRYVTLRYVARTTPFPFPLHA